MQPIYLDYNATTPIAREVADAMAPYLYEHFGNPSSLHRYGTATRRALETARRQVAALIRCQPDEVIFTSGGTESNNYAIKGIASAYRARGNHIITTAVEHPAVLEVCRWLEGAGFRITVLPVDPHGRVDPASLEAACGADTLLVTIMHANNEVGTIQPLAELARIAHRHGALVHTDAAQSVGKIPVDVEALGVDLLSMTGHKLYAPKGVGALYVREGVRLDALMHGAGHEAGRRPGTENVLQVVGLGAACARAAQQMAQQADRCRALRDRLQDGLQQALSTQAVRLNGHPTERLPNTLSLSFRGVEADTLLAEISDRVAVSAGAACHADQVDLSSVLQAMQLPVDWAMGTVRFSLGHFTTDDEVEQTIAILSEAVRRLQPDARDPDVAPQGSPEDPPRLTRYTHGLGCACKLRPQALDALLQQLPRRTHPQVLVGLAAPDDAAVYRLTDDLAVVQTADFFTPIVDDPYTFGAIAAANALSDLYAMGAEPLFALNLVGFPTRRLPLETLHQMLRGAADKADEAGIPIIGGHTIEDVEPKFGLSVTGRIHPDRILRNSTARPGDVLLLTKPLGTGILATAAKQGQADAADLGGAIAVMLQLNKAAAEAMAGFDVHACTDVTGFGLLGHAREMALGSGVNIVLTAERVPMLPGAHRLAASGIVPGGTQANLDYVAPHVDFDAGISKATRYVLADAQTSGGLLISVAPEEADDLGKELRAAGYEEATRIGTVREPGRGRISVT